MLSGKSLAILWLSVLCMVACYFFPVWTISLSAPQFPEGLGMHIWIDKITGHNPHDIDNINKMNKYIGMKAIEPAKIPELKYVKYILMALIAMSFICAVLRKKKVVVIWIVLAILCGLLGLYDFYAWGYDYGHNLKPNPHFHAKGLDHYQPPLIGYKQVLNFTAGSFPHLGGLLYMAAIFLAMLSLYLEQKLIKKTEREEVTTETATSIVFLLLTVCLFSCEPKKEPIAFGEDTCAQCKMIISDQRYGAEVVTKKGRIYKFDSVECLVNDSLVAEQDIHSRWTVNFADPKTLIPVENALYLHSDKLASPMGLNVSCFSSEDQLKKIQDKYGGQKITWQKTIELARKWKEEKNLKAKVNIHKEKSCDCNKKEHGK